MNRLFFSFLLIALGMVCGVGRSFAAESLTVFFTANTYGAFAPCPT